MAHFCKKLQADCRRGWMLALTAMLIVFAPAAFAQSAPTVTGTVTDQSGQPVIGATIIEQGTTNGATTGVDGSYSLKLRGGGNSANLIFQSLGFVSQTVAVNGRTKIDVKLAEDAVALDAVVAIGYGTVKQKDLTTAVSVVKKLGPAFRKAGIDTKILCYDHNYNYDNVAGQQNYPLNIYADADAAQWVDGSAWHNYGGSVSELDNIRAAAPDKTIYFTEASIGTWNYNFESCVIDDFESIFLGTLSRYGKGVLLWNLMLDDKGAPNRPGGCTTCYGAIEISSSDYKTLKYNSHYYDLAQCAKVIRPGAVRIGASGYTASGLTYLAFRNPDGSKAFVALNRSAGEQTVAVYENADRSFKYTIPAKSIASFRWGAGAEN